MELKWFLVGISTVDWNCKDQNHQTVFCIEQVEWLFSFTFTLDALFEKAMKMFNQGVQFVSRMWYNKTTWFILTYRNTHWNPLNPQNKSTVKIHQKSLTSLFITFQTLFYIHSIQESCRFLLMFVNRSAPGTHHQDPTWRSNLKAINPFKAWRARQKRTWWRHQPKMFYM